MRIVRSSCNVETKRLRDRKLKPSTRTAHSPIAAAGPSTITASCDCVRCDHDSSAGTAVGPNATTRRASTSSLATPQTHTQVLLSRLRSSVLPNPPVALPSVTRTRGSPSTAVTLPRLLDSSADEDVQAGMESSASALDGSDELAALPISDSTLSDFRVSRAASVRTSPSQNNREALIFDNDTMLPPRMGTPIPARREGVSDEADNQSAVAVLQPEDASLTSIGRRTQARVQSGIRARLVELDTQISLASLSRAQNAIEGSRSALAQARVAIRNALLYSERYAVLDSCTLFNAYLTSCSRLERIAINLRRQVEPQTTPVDTDSITRIDLAELDSARTDLDLDRSLGDLRAASLEIDRVIALSRAPPNPNSTADLALSSSNLRRSNTSPSRRSASPASVSDRPLQIVSPLPAPSAIAATNPNASRHLQPSVSVTTYDSTGRPVVRHYTRTPPAASGTRDASSPFSFRTRWLSSDSAGVTLPTLAGNGQTEGPENGDNGSNANVPLNIFTRSARPRRVPLQTLANDQTNDANTVQLARDVLANSRVRRDGLADFTSFTAEDSDDTPINPASAVDGEGSSGIRRRRRGGWMRLDANGDEIEVSSSDEERHSTANSLQSDSVPRRGTGRLGWRWRPASPVPNNEEAEEDKDPSSRMGGVGGWEWENRQGTGSETTRRRQWRFRGNREMVGR